MEGKWIWPVGMDEHENQRACFAAFFETDLNPEAEEPVLHISASTRYIAYVNGRELGRGPGRSGRSRRFYDTFSLAGKLREGNNYLAVRVWSYGWSTYQSIQAPGGLLFEVVQGKQTLAASGCRVRALEDVGHQVFAPKRNVNLGFTDFYDARRFDASWTEKPELVKDWPFAREVQDPGGILQERVTRPFTWQNQYPQHIVAMQQVKKGCRQITVNTRRAFFDDRRDANETIFSGFLGFEFVCRREMEGVIAFPNRTWNGLIGDFRIDSHCYPVTNENRTISVTLGSGRHLFLMQLSGKYDDLYCHMEFDFPEPFDILLNAEGRSFFTVGPTQRILPVIDGIQMVYGGLSEFNRMERETPEHERLFAVESSGDLRKLAEKFGVRFRWVEQHYVFEDSYLLSLARTEKVVKEEAVLDSQMGILWANDCDTVFLPTDVGDYRRLIVDFGDIYAGSFELLVLAESGTVLDVYCFENMYDGEIDYTIGLNNGFRYICRKGWQRYSCMARIGCRYAMITVRNTRKPVYLREFHMRSMTYSATKRGEFACDDYLLNRIWEMCCHTHELCLEDSFTDCPTYEQAFWIGDSQLTALINAYVYGDYSLIVHNLRLAVTATENTMLMNALTPTDWNTSIPMWMMNWVIAIDQYIEITGDESVLGDLYPSVRAVLRYYEQFIQPDGAFLISSWNMMDWAAMDINNYGVVTGQQAILAWCFRLASGFACLLGLKEEATDFEKTRGKLLSYIDRSLWDGKRQCYLDGWSPENGFSKTVSIQTHALMYLYQGILGEQKKKVTETLIVNPPEEFVMVGSPFMLYYLHSCLLQMGETEQVLEDIRQRWGEMLRYDSTTCWEVFPGFYENSRTRSYCHSWSAAPAAVLLEWVLGVKRIKEGWSEIRIQVPERTGNWCRGAVPTPFGTIRASWDRKEKRFRLQIPDRIRADVSALDGWDVQIMVTE